MENSEGWALQFVAPTMKKTPSDGTRGSLAEGEEQMSAMWRYHDDEGSNSTSEDEKRRRKWFEQFEKLIFQNIPGWRRRLGIKI